ncbi:helix-turn-helix domain-containing protein [Cellulomonas triticagri]|uniref:LysR family transcriptional regulator n=1 Tax=Cellulomonas triticagri TaxID=2483352 RepID=A0A3M2JPY8_9CELL|nr:LysR family transcriptional regulator [Cellulomonas triticagri]RMI13880.1 LysR family transcriptional regulator [Cellulomonas triticagri]
MNLNGLRAFVAVGELGSIRDAAVELGYSESAVSRHLTAFERSVGGAVFERERAGMRLTDRGEAILPLAHEALGTVAAIVGDPGTARPGHVETATSATVRA